MRLLLVGMDGAQINTFQRGWTPFLSSILGKGSCLDLNEDLITRGWSKIAFGKSGLETGALFNRPVLNGTHEWSLKFELNDIFGLGVQIKPIWQVLNEMGYSVGVMNLPTTFPAPKVNGFFVSGGGGGAKVVCTPAKEHCYPESVLDRLIELNYIVDERLDTLLVQKKLYDPYHFFSKLKEKNEKRTKAFIDLAKHYDVDFGFIVYRSSSNLAEFLLLPTWKRYLEKSKYVDADFIEAVKDYYQHFDKQIKILMSNFESAETILVSDHGMAARQWSVNLNTFLQETGMQVRSSAKSCKSSIINHMKKYIPFSLRQILRSNKFIKKQYESLTSFDNDLTQAFSMIIADSVRGIYVNDKERFGGPVSSHADRVRVAEKIVQDFNIHPDVIKHNLKAKVKIGDQNRVYKYFPDVIITMPDGYVASNDFDKFILPYCLPNIPLGISSVTQGRLLCGKGVKPLAVNVKNEWQIPINKSYSDLRLIYDHVVTTMSSMEVK